MSAGSENTHNGGYASPGSEGEDRDIFLFLCNIIHEGYYNMRITWGEARKLFSVAVTGSPLEICRNLREEGYIGAYDDPDPFMILRNIRVDLSPETEKATFRKLLETLRSEPLPYNVAMVSYLQKGLMMGIISSFYDHELNFARTPEERTLISVVTSDLFLSNRYVSGLLEDEVKIAEIRDPGMEDYVQYSWFNELVQIIKNGYYGNNGVNYIDMLENSSRVEFSDGILEIITNGGLLWLILNFKQFLKRDHVDMATKKFVKKSRQERGINRFYDWLSMVNDFAVGVEFLIGSIEFLPNYDPTFGVYLFIVGSTQLLIRPVISLGRKIHLHRLENRKIRF